MTAKGLPVVAVVGTVTVNTVAAPGTTAKGMVVAVTEPAVTVTVHPVVVTVSSVIVSTPKPLPNVMVPCEGTCGSVLVTTATPLKLTVALFASWAIANRPKPDPAVALETFGKRKKWSMVTIRKETAADVALLPATSVATARAR